MTYENILRNKLWHQLPSNADAFRHLSSPSLPLIPPAWRSSPRRLVEHVLWAARAFPLSSVCLLNDSNYFPQLQATHACFISASTFPICLYRPRFHTAGVQARSSRASNPAGIPVLPSTWDPTVLCDSVFCLVGQKTRMDYSF